MKKIQLIFVVVVMLFFACKKNAPTVLRSYQTSFESVAEFSDKDFYITPQNYLNSSSHELDDSIVHSGTFSHKGWMYAANAPSTQTTNNNHRAYPTIQLHKTDSGSFRTPCYVTFWVWLDMALGANTPENDWFSFATFTSDQSDNWARTVLINLTYQGQVRLMHVPEQGQQEHIYQPDTLDFPQRKWVQIKAYLDFGTNGYAKVWQDGVLVSHAKVKGTSGRLAQAHFGLYAPPQLTSGVIYNDDLTIWEVDGE